MYGLVASRDLDENEYITAYPGAAIAQKDDNQSDYIVDIDRYNKVKGKNLVIDAAEEMKIIKNPYANTAKIFNYNNGETKELDIKELLGGFANHCSFPNAEIAEPIEVDGSITQGYFGVYIRSIRPIKKGTQILVDYGSDYNLYDAEQHRNVNYAKKIQGQCLDASRYNGIARVKHVNAGNNDTYRVIYDNGHVSTLRVFYPRTERTSYSIQSPIRSATVNADEGNPADNVQYGTIDVTVGPLDLPYALVVAECVDLEKLKEGDVALDEAAEKNMLENGNASTASLKGQVAPANAQIARSPIIKPFAETFEDLNRNYEDPQFELFHLRDGDKTDYRVFVRYKEGRDTLLYSNLCPLAVLVNMEMASLNEKNTRAVVKMLKGIKGVLGSIRTNSVFFNTVTAGNGIRDSDMYALLKDSPLRNTAISPFLASDKNQFDLNAFYLGLLNRTPQTIYPEDFENTKAIPLIATKHEQTEINAHYVLAVLFNGKVHIIDNARQTDDNPRPTLLKDWKENTGYELQGFYIFKQPFVDLAAA